MHIDSNKYIYLYDKNLRSLRSYNAHLSRYRKLNKLSTVFIENGLSLGLMNFLSSTTSISAIVSSGATEGLTSDAVTASPAIEEVEVFRRSTIENLMEWLNDQVMELDAYIVEAIKVQKTVIDYQHANFASIPKMESITADELKSVSGEIISYDNLQSIVSKVNDFERLFMDLDNNDIEDRIKEFDEHRDLGTVGNELGAILDQLHIFMNARYNVKKASTINDLFDYVDFNDEAQTIMYNGVSPIWNTEIMSLVAGGYDKTEIKDIIVKCLDLRSSLCITFDKIKSYYKNTQDVLKKLESLRMRLPENRQVVHNEDTSSNDEMTETESQTESDYGNLAAETFDFNASDAVIESKRIENDEYNRYRTYLDSVRTQVCQVISDRSVDFMIFSRMSLRAQIACISVLELLKKVSGAELVPISQVVGDDHTDETVTDSIGDTHSREAEEDLIMDNDFEDDIDIETEVTTPDEDIVTEKETGEVDEPTEDTVGAIEEEDAPTFLDTVDTDPTPEEEEAAAAEAPAVSEDAIEPEVAGDVEIDTEAAAAPAGDLELDEPGEPADVGEAAPEAEVADVGEPDGEVDLEADLVDDDATSDDAGEGDAVADDFEADLAEDHAEPDGDEDEDGAEPIDASDDDEDLESDLED